MTNTKQGKLVSKFLEYVDDNQTRRVSSDVLVDEFSRGRRLSYQMQINLRTALWERGVRERLDS